MKRSKGGKKAGEKQKNQCSAHNVDVPDNMFRKLIARIYAFFVRIIKSKKSNAADDAIDINISFIQIDGIKDTEVLNDYLQFLEDEYRGLSNRLSNLSEKYNFVLTVISILLGSNIVLSPQILIKNDSEISIISTMFAGIYFLFSVILVIVFCIFLHNYKEKTDYKIVSETDLTKRAEYCSNIADYEKYKKEKAKILLYIVHNNHKTIEDRKKTVKNLILSIQICSIGIFISALMILYYTQAKNTFSMIIDIIKSFLI
ncbi:MAG: hypothetical protein ACTTH7_09790 [Treponema sp.]